MSEERTLRLSDPFQELDIEWRVARAGGGETPWCQVLAYITNRAIMDRLDAVVGPYNWKNEYKPGPQGGVICGISIRQKDEWVTKWDGAENTKIESVKGGLSDSMKRAAVQWGIGRYLYKVPGNLYAEIVPKGKGEHFQPMVKPNGRKQGHIAFGWNPPKIDWGKFEK